MTPDGRNHLSPIAIVALHASFRSNTMIVCTLWRSVPLLAKDMSIRFYAFSVIHGEVASIGYTGRDGEALKRTRLKEAR